MQIQLTTEQLWAALAGLGAGLLVGALLAAWRGGRRIQRLERDLAVQAERLRGEHAIVEERDEVIERADQRLTHLLSELADKALQSRSEAFLRLARESVGQQQAQAGAELRVTLHELVTPIRQALQKTEQQVARIEAERQQAYGRIRAELEAMHEAQQALRRETRQLVTALRRPEVRGQWGELTLRRLVELAGMVEHCDFLEQPHHSDGEGAIRPDMIIRLPESRELVVDAKTPLDAYLEATEAADDASRSAALARHARNLRNHVHALSDRRYWERLDASPEFVILFVPGDQFLSAALEKLPDLLDEAIRRKVILATPTSLVALLKSVAYGWRQLSLARNAVKIRDIAETLYRRLGTFTSHLGALGRQLESSVKGYNRAVGSFERSVLPSARRFAELGIEGEELTPLEPLEQVPRTASAPPPGAAASDEAGADGAAPAGSDVARDDRATGGAAAGGDAPGDPGGVPGAGAPSGPGPQDRER